LGALVVAAVFGVSIAGASAQPSSTTTETKKFEVIAVEGNQLVVKLPEGTREITVPEGFRFTVNGQSLSVQELQPGMAGTAVITKTTTVKPVTVTEVKNGTVAQVAGSSVIVRGENGYRMFSPGDIEKRHITIMKGGKPANLSDLRVGDRLSATFVTEKPPQVMTEQQVNATLNPTARPAAGTGGGTAATAGGSGATTAASRTPAPSAPATPAAGGSARAGRRLPKTASALPLLGLLGLASLAIGVSLTSLRRRRIAG
jgi:hypothetical protein